MKARRRFSNRFLKVDKRAAWPQKDLQVAPRWCSQFCAAMDIRERIAIEEDVVWCSKCGWQQDHPTKEHR